jgi:hypothetical protein
VFEPQRVAGYGNALGYIFREKETKKPRGMNAPVAV